MTVEDGTTKNGLVHRSYDEFQTLDQMIRRDIWIRDPKAKLPSEDEASTASLSGYLSALYDDDGVRGSTMFADFLSINWDGSKVTFMTSLAGFMKMLLWDRLPDFMPERKDMSKSNCFIEASRIYPVH